ncbi:MAG: hypothetical protein JSR78_06570 [Proteobacteria bacterium]|nr:hypothetical protein [Pseudomonadota bacterium]
MTQTMHILLNSTNAALIIFTAAAGLAAAFTKSPFVRFGAGLAVIAATLCIFAGPRSLFMWTVSAVERPSFPGFVLLCVLSISTTTGRRVATSAEYRFATLAFALAGLALYPSATGFINADPYVLGYSGYVLPAALAVVIAYALWRGYFISAFALNVGIAAFLLGAGPSRNLWDYIMDPVASIIGCGTWIVLAIGFLTGLTKRAKILSPTQPSAGIGETPISH